MNLVEYTSALAGGLLSFFSPCIFPLIPGYISLISGVSLHQAEKAPEHSGLSRHAGLCAIFFVAGFSGAFMFLGAQASIIGRALVQNSGILSTAAALLLIGFGLHMAGLLTIKIFEYEKKIPLGKFHSGFAGAFAMGLVFAIGWSPCIGPILAGFIAMAATEKTAVRGMLLLFFYSMGLGIPFIIAGFGIGHLSAMMKRYRKTVAYTKKAAGAFLIFLGIAILFRDKLYFFEKFLPI